MSGIWKIWIISINGHIDTMDVFFFNIYSVKDVIASVLGISKNKEKKTFY